jgi:hypothetical protein
MSIRKLNRENIRIGENLRQAIMRAKARDAWLTNKYIAEAADIHPVSLSRILKGYGASTGAITRVAAVIGADVEKILNKGTRKPIYSVRTIEEVINDNAILDQFIGGGDPVALDWTKEQLYNIFAQCSKRRTYLMKSEVLK